MKCALASFPETASPSLLGPSPSFLLALSLCRHSSLFLSLPHSLCLCRCLFYLSLSLSLSLSLPPSLSLSRPLALSPSLPLSLALSPSLPLPLSLPPSLSLPLSLCLSLSVSPRLSESRFRSRSRSRSFARSRSHFRSPALSRTHSLPHAHTLSRTLELLHSRLLSLSLALSPPEASLLGSLSLSRSLRDDSRIRSNGPGRYAVVDNQGNSPGYLQTFFTCDPKWCVLILRGTRPKPSSVGQPHFLALLGASCGRGDVSMRKNIVMAPSPRIRSI